MAKRRVYDEPNPFAPDVRERRFNSTKPDNKPSTSSGRGKPNFKRLKTRLHGMDEYSRHKQLINNYVLYNAGSTAKLQRDTTNDRNIYDVVRDNHRFLWDDNLSAEEQLNWEMKLAKKYYDKLFKEYCIADLSQYAKNRVAMRWRVEREVFSGKGQFECGNKHCENRDELSSWEVNFAYVENGERKNALVKLRLCPDCSAKLNFHSKKRLIKKETKQVKEDLLLKKKQINKAKKRKHSEKKKNKHHKKRKVNDDESDSSNSDLNNTSPVPLSDKIAVKEESKEVEKVSNQDEVIADAADIWTKKAAALRDKERTVMDEFDDFIDDLLF